MRYILSIIVPVYKVEPYIRKCIESILGQTFKEFELILVDDGSPDKSGEICDEYAEIDNRIKVIHKGNSGVADSRNAGIAIAEGEYIGFIDGDDYIEADMYETLLNLSKYYEADVVECGFTMVRGSDHEAILTNNKIIVGDRLIALDLLSKFWSHCSSCNKIYKRYLFSEIRFPSGKIHEEEAIMHRIFFAINRYVYTGECKYFYVQREGSIMHQGYSLKRLDRLEAFEDRFYFLKDNIQDDVIIRSEEYKLFMSILENYFGLNNNSKLDPHKTHREFIRKCILKNYNGFLRNEQLIGYKRFIMLAKWSKFLFDLVYNVRPKLRNYFLYILNRR